MTLYFECCGCVFCWDENKETGAYKVHHIHFIDATTIFNDLTRYEELDEKHSSISEERFKTIVMAVVDGAPMVITVVYTVEENNVIRIITAWKATVEEVKKYKG